MEELEVQKVKNEKKTFLKESPIDSDEEEPDVEDIKDSKITSDNHTTCINSDVSGLKEVFDEDTCTGVLIGYYDAFSKDL
jgi:hypothetical protein